MRHEFNHSHIGFIWVSRSSNLDKIIDFVLLLILISMGIHLHLFDST